MNAQQLRNSIFQEAIEGRLVPQDPNDEPSSVLLERIREEKKRLVKEGKLKKKDLEEKPISEDEKPFEIPESWEWVRLGNVCNDISDIDHKMPPVVENGIPYISPLNFRKDGSIDYVNAKKISIEDFKQLSRKCKPERDDLIFPRYGTIGVIRKVDTDIDFLVSYSCATIKPHLKSVDANYINAVLNSQLIQSVEIQRYINKTTQPNVGLQSIKLFLFPLPPLAEQHRIVAKIEELLPKVEEYGKAQDALNKLNAELPERLKKSILQEAISGRLVPQDPNDEPASVLLDKIRKEKAQLVKEGKLKKKDLEEKPISEDEKPFDIPDNWMWCKLGTIAAVLGGKRIPAGRKLTIENTGHIYIRVSDMKENSVSTDNLQYVPEDIFPSISRYIINKEDVYITVAGTIGKIGKIPSELDGANLTENADRLVFSHINQDWLIKCLESNVVQTQITNVTTKVGQPKLAIQKIQALLIPFPPLAEQKRIVKKIEELFAEIDKLK